MDLRVVVVDSGREEIVFIELLIDENDRGEVGPVGQPRVFDVFAVIPLQTAIGGHFVVGAQISGRVIGHRPGVLFDAVIVLGIAVFAEVAVINREVADVALFFGGLVPIIGVVGHVPIRHREALVLCAQSTKRVF